MDKVMMWTIEGAQASPVHPIGRMDSERGLEEILVKNPELMPELTLVGQQMGTESGRLDLLGVDRDGRLVVVELKRGTLSRGAIAQIIDYASSLEEMDLGTLVKYISDKSGAHGIDDFEKWYTENFRVEDLESLRPLRMFLVGLGADDTTERMVNFLSNRNMDISLLTFYGFTYEGKTLLVRQVHQEGNDDENSKPIGGYRAYLASRIEKYGVSDLFTVAKKMFQENWHNPKERIGKYGLNFYLPNKKEMCARLSVKEHGLYVTFFSSAIRLCIDDFKLPIQKIPFRTWPLGHENTAHKDLNTALEKCNEIQFLVDEPDCPTQKENLCELDKLTRALYDAQQRKMQDAQQRKMQ